MPPCIDVSGIRPSLGGIGITIGAIVDMGIIVTENILKHLDAADPEENPLEVVYRRASEVSGGGNQMAGRRK